MNEILPSAEAAELAACEQVIERGLKTFAEVGTALLKIRDDRLYRASHGTFEDYCRERWQLSARHANRTIEAARVAEILGPIGPSPANEAQARELAPLLGDPDRLRDTWRRAVESSGGKPTAADVAEARDPVPSEAASDPYLAELAAAAEVIAELGLCVTDEITHMLAERAVIQQAARRLLRHGAEDMPPGAWKQAQSHTPHAEANRLNEWRLRVMWQAGDFLNWCKKAGIELGKAGFVFADQLRYPAEAGELELLNWTPLDEHHAVLGHFYLWWYTPDELRALAGVKLPATATTIAVLPELRYALNGGAS